MNTIEQMNKAADNNRILVAAMVEKAKSGHPGGAIGADFINVLYSEFLEPTRKSLWEGRDRFSRPRSHGANVVFGVIACTGKFRWTICNNCVSGAV